MSKPNKRCKWLTYNESFEFDNTGLYHGRHFDIQHFVVGNHTIINGIRGQWKPCVRNNYQYSIRETAQMRNARINNPYNQQLVNHICAVLNELPTTKFEVGKDVPYEGDL